MRIIIIVIMLLLSACAASPEAIQQAIAETQAAWTPVPTQTAYPTYTPQSTYTAAPTAYIIVIVTRTSTPTPIFTPEPTTDPLFDIHTSGFYLVGVDIASGIWRSDGTGDSCYWSVTKANGDIMDNHFGQSGGTAYIPANAFQVEFNDCGNWSFISGP